ncbi:hypothetical protein G8759_25190 [Spirosoma aureum]|uniref:Uncharacterized protein n=1 Tax=Spirosoma aureum TaxID=2692134 RepID=A0A6G9AT75_9BACT|nr:hypothetical protein [Spirosoma aureum]QIP15692.1 hypothetical protein G8759_25190 [Spirosoma aureum]
MATQSNKPQIPAWLEFVVDKLVLILLILLENWLIIFVFLMAFGVISSCKSKPQAPAQSIPTMPPIDSVRLKLEQEAQWSSGNGMATSKQQSQSAIIDYEKAKQYFDTSRVTLP